MTTSVHAASETRPASDPGIVRADVEIAASPDEVFRSLTDPDELAAWWGSEETHRTRDWQVDARPGGEWSMRTTDAAGNDGTVHGEYVVVDAPRLLEYTWHASWDDFAATRVRFDLTPATVDGAPGTRLTVTHTGFAGSVACAASAFMQAPDWTRTLERLALYAMGCARRATPMMRMMPKTPMSPVTIRSTRHRRRPARAMAQR